jgi:AcrR family transcriptional regulator
MLVKDPRDKKNPATGARRMNGEKRRQKIADAAVKLFAEYGFSGTTTKEIAKTAGISEASLFQHFKTKADLYAEILEGKTKRIYESGWMKELNEFAARNEDEKVFRAIALKIMEHCRKDPNFIRLMLYTALEKHENAQPFRRQMLYPIFELLRDYIEKRKAQGVFQECSAEAAAFAFISTQVYYAMGNTLFQSKMISISSDEAISNFIKLSLDGLRKDASGREQKDDFCRKEEK